MTLRALRDKITFKQIESTMEDASKVTDVAVEGRGGEGIKDGN